MTAPTLTARLTTIGWTATELSRRLVVNDRTVRRWLAGENQAPRPIIDWLEKLAAYIETNPPPRP